MATNGSFKVCPSDTVAAAGQPFSGRWKQALESGPLQVILWRVFTLQGSLHFPFKGYNLLVKTSFGGSKAGHEQMSTLSPSVVLCGQDQTEPRAQSHEKKEKTKHLRVSADLKAKASRKKKQQQTNNKQKQKNTKKHAQANAKGTGRRGIWAFFSSIATKSSVHTYGFNTGPGVLSAPSK